MTEHPIHNAAPLAVDEELWRATFTEFKSQALRTFQGNLFDIASGGWVDVGLAAAAAGETKEWSDIWPQQQWHIAFEILLCQQPPSIQAILPEHDDLLFFVYWSDLAKSKGSRIFARRKQKIKNMSSALPSDLSWDRPLAAEIDWRSSLLLNIVLQTQYQLTVVRCLPWEVDKILDNKGTPVKKPAAERGDPQQEQSTQSMQSIQVTKRVHASPSTTPVNLDQSKAQDSAPSVSYPNICFAVDDFVEAFESLTLDDPIDCYCVVLHADVASTWKNAAAVVSTEVVGDASQNKEENKREDEGLATTPSKAGKKESIDEEINSLETSFKESLRMETPSPTRRNILSLEESSTISVFNGYVSCKQLTLALSSYLQNPIKLLLRHQWKNKNKGAAGGGGSGQGQTAKVLMRGPGGIGSAEVAVTPLETGDREGAKMVLAKVVFKNAVAAVKTAVQVGEQGTSVPGGSETTAMKLQCALMAVNMPVEALAEQILKNI